MRVTHVITRLIVGGAQENTIASVLGLHRRPDVKVHLIAGPTTGPEGSLECLLDGVPGILTVVPHLVRPVHPWHDPMAWGQLTRLLRREAPDIVHTHSGKAGILGRLAARAARVRCIVHTIHGPSFGDFQGPVANLFFCTAERLVARVTSHYVVVADAMTRQYLAAGIGRPERFTRIFSGFDLDPFLAVRRNPDVRDRLGLGPEHFVVGKIARLFELKGHDDLIAAAPDLVRAYPQIRFLLVGDGPARQRFETEIARRGLEGHFVLTGLVTPGTVPELLGAMDVVVHLSRREGLARALPQALAAGRPIVAYDCDGAAEVCFPGRTGFLVPPGNLAALQEAFGRLATDPQLGPQLGECGRHWVRDRFPAQRMVDQLHALYVRLLSNDPAAIGSAASPIPSS